MYILEGFHSFRSIMFIFFQEACGPLGLNTRKCPFCRVKDKNNHKSKTVGQETLHVMLYEGRIVRRGFAIFTAIDYCAKVFI